MNILEFPNFSPLSLVQSIVAGPITACKSPVLYFLAFRKVPENPVITPNATTQVVVPSAENRFLQSVTVNPVTTTTTEG